VVLRCVSRTSTRGFRWLHAGGITTESYPGRESKYGRIAFRPACRSGGSNGSFECPTPNKEYRSGFRISFPWDFEIPCSKFDIDFAWRMRTWMPQGASPNQASDIRLKNTTSFQTSNFQLPTSQTPHPSQPSEREKFHHHQ
jgi:hypothetical protein